MEKIDERLTIVHDGRLGPTLIRTVELTEPSYVAFRWEVPGGSPLTSTLVQFWVSKQGTDTVLLRVRESGFAVVDECDENVTLEANDEGWVEALQAVRRFFE